MNVLISGGAGYIGSFCCRSFLERGFSVDVLDDFSTGHRAAVPQGLTVHECNLLDTARVSKIFRHNKYDAVVHFAAKSLVGESATDPLKYYENNVAGTIGLIIQAQMAGIKKFIFSSTAAVYGNPSGNLDESHPTVPINPYGRSKLAVEQVFRDACSAYGLKCIPLRYFNAAGAALDGTTGEDHEPETHLIPLAIQAAFGKRPPLQVFGSDYDTPDGTPIRDYIHVLDLCEAHILALLSLEKQPDGYFRPFNVGTGGGYSVFEVLAAIEAETGKEVPRFVGPRRAGDPVKLVADSSAIKETLGWSPKYSDLKTIVRCASSWHRSHPNGYGQRVNQLAPSSD